MVLIWSQSPNLILKEQEGRLATNWELQLKNASPFRIRLDRAIMLTLRSTTPTLSQRKMKTSPIWKIATCFNSLDLDSVVKQSLKKQDCPKMASAGEFFSFEWERLPLALRCGTLNPFDAAAMIWFSRFLKQSLQFYPLPLHLTSSFLASFLTL